MALHAVLAHLSLLLADIIIGSHVSGSLSEETYWSDSRNMEIVRLKRRAKWKEGLWQHF